MHNGSCPTQATTITASTTRARITTTRTGKDRTGQEDTPIDYRQTWQDLSSPVLSCPILSKSLPNAQLYVIICFATPAASQQHGQEDGPCTWSWSWSSNCSWSWDLDLANAGQPTTITAMLPDNHVSLSQLSLHICHVHWAKIYVLTYILES